MSWAMGENLTLKDELHVRFSARSVDTPPLTDCAPFTICRGIPDCQLPR
jgi:hypothetical protein